MSNITIDEAAQLDRQCRQLVELHSRARIKIGLELAAILRRFRDENLFMKLDQQSYPTFPRYLESLGIKYKTAMEIIGLYESFIIAGGYTIDQLAGAPYHHLTTIKPLLFKKEGGQYLLTKSKDEADKWVDDAKSELTQDDLKQKRMEEEVGPHDHEFKEVRYRVCSVCKLREYGGKEHHG